MISVIIPVYNSVSTLERCLDSLLNQSFQDFEICLVDDGSNDGSSFICDKYSTDNRVIVTHQDNTGVSRARNVGLRMSRGDWVCFVDSDDWVEPDYLINLVSATEKECDIAVGGFVVDKPNSIKVFSFKDVSFIMQKENADLFYSLVKSRLLFGPVAKLFKKDIINDYCIKFPESISYGEDRLFNYEYLSHVDSVSAVSDTSYHYVQSNSNSLSSKCIDGLFDLEFAQWKKLKELLLGKHMLNKRIMDDLDIELFWIIVDNLSYNNKQSRVKFYSFIKKVLSTPEISDIKSISSLIDYNRLIKFSIIQRLSLLYFITTIFR